MSGSYLKTHEICSGGEDTDVRVWKIAHMAAHDIRQHPNRYALQTVANDMFTVKNGW